MHAMHSHPVRLCLIVLALCIPLMFGDVSITTHKTVTIETDGEKGGVTSIRAENMRKMKAGTNQSERPSNSDFVRSLDHRSQDSIEARIIASRSRVEAQLVYVKNVHSLYLGLQDVAGDAIHAASRVVLLSSCSELTASIFADIALNLDWQDDTSRMIKIVVDELESFSPGSDTSVVEIENKGSEVNPGNEPASTTQFRSLLQSSSNESMSSRSSSSDEENSRSEHSSRSENNSKGSSSTTVTKRTNVSVNLKGSLSGLKKMFGKLMKRSEPQTVHYSQPSHCYVCHPQYR